MKKQKKHKLTTSDNLYTSSTELGRGEIKDNFLAALVTSKVYKLQVVKSKKGKGSYQRKDKHKGREPYLIAA
jgi:alternative ribosome-rescue factor